MKTNEAFIILSLMLLSPISRAGHEEGNGGDAVAQSFVSAGFAALSDLKKASNLPAELSLNELESILKTTQVISQDRVSLPGPDGYPVERDAINLPQANPPTIIVNRSRWLGGELSATDKEKLALHEYLGIMGLERNSYWLSERLAPALGSPARGSNFAQCQVKVAGTTQVVTIPMNRYSGEGWQIHFTPLLKDGDRIVQFGSRFDNGPVAGIYIGKAQSGGVAFPAAALGALPLSYYEPTFSIYCE